MLEMAESHIEPNQKQFFTTEKSLIEYWIKRGAVYNANWLI